MHHMFDSSIDVPIPQYTRTFCVVTQSYIAALKSVVSAASLKDKPHCVSKLLRSSWHYTPL